MAISSSETARVACPACGHRFSAEVWALVDAAERPDLAAALRDGTIDTIACPQCGHQWPAGAALLFHDPANRRVYFAVPPDVGEHIWREQAQALLYALVGELPEDARLPYLGDVQVEHEVAGVRRAVLRRERVRRGAGPAQPGFGKPVESVIGALASSPPVAPKRQPATPAVPEDAALAEAVHALLAADDQDEFLAIVAASPALLTEQGDETVRQLADLAYGQGDRAVSDALRELRATLARMRAGGPAVLPPEPAAESAPAAAQPTGLSDIAYQALLQVASPAGLSEAARDYPQLLEARADADLAARFDAALDEGNERLAQLIDERREALAELRERVSAPEALQAALRALLDARTDDALAEVLGANPVLLTDSAQEALAMLGARAQSQGQQQMAEDAEARQALLRKVRAGLDVG